MPRFAMVAARGLCALTLSCMAKLAPGQTTQPVLEEVLVTAQKQAESAQDIPIALSVLSGESLVKSGVYSLSDLQNVAPSVNVGRDSFGLNINIRGVTTTDTTSKGEQGIAYTMDGIAIGRPREQGASFFDIARVEVLRGPQGTLYGKSTTGGVINVITRRPEREFAAGADLEIGNFDARRVMATLNVPAGAKVAVRAAISSNRRDGWLVTDDGSSARNDQDDLAGRVSASIGFSPDTSLFLTATAGRLQGVGAGQIPYETFRTQSGQAQRRVYGNPFGGDVDETFHNQTVEFNTALGALQLTYVGGYREYETDTVTSSSFDPAGNNPPQSYGWSQYRGDTSTHSHELRLANDPDSVVRWLGGVNWYREEVRESDHRWTAPVIDPTLAGSVNGIDPLNETTHESSGIFSQASWRATDELKVTLGVRYSKDEVSRVGTFAAGPMNFSTAPPSPWLDPSGRPCAAPNDCVGTLNNGRQSDDKVTYRLGADYHLGTGRMLFASVATGYKAGGFNDFDPSTGGTGAYGPESLTAYELGFKGDLTDALQLNSVAYYYDYRDNQVSSLVNINGTFVIYTRLVPATLYGWENELRFAATDNDVIDAAVTLAHAEYDELDAGLFQNVNWAGYTLDKVADVTASLAYTHKWRIGDGASLAARVATRYNSGYVVSNFVSALQFEQESFTRSDVDITYLTANERLSIGLFARNLEDELQLLNAPENFNPAFPNGSSVSVSEPRTYGMRVGLRF